MGLRTPSRYQPNNLKIAAVARPARIAERLSSVKVNTFSASAEGLRFRRFSSSLIGKISFHFTR